MRNLYSVFCAWASIFVVLIASSYFDVPDMWVLSFFSGMRLHFAVAIVLLSGIALLCRRGFIGVCFFGLGLLFAGHAVYLERTFAFQPEIKANAPSFRLISFNILGDNPNGAAIAKMLVASNADVVFTLESEPLAKSLDLLDATYPYRVGCGHHTKTCDLMMMSKFPLDAIKVHSLGPFAHDRFITAEINVGGKKVNLAAMHLTKPYFDEFHSDNLFLASHFLRKIDGPLLLAGDFNSSTLATDVRHFMSRTGLRTAGYQPHTWPVELPQVGLAIDHVLTRRPLAIRSVKRLSDNYGSNHFGLAADIALTDGN